MGLLSHSTDRDMEVWGFEKVQLLGQGHRAGGSLVGLDSKAHLVESQPLARPQDRAPPSPLPPSGPWPPEPTWEPGPLSLAHGAQACWSRRPIRGLNRKETKVPFEGCCLFPCL